MESFLSNAKCYCASHCHEFCGRCAIEQCVRKNLVHMRDCAYGTVRLYGTQCTGMSYNNVKHYHCVICGVMRTEVTRVITQDQGGSLVGL